MKFRKDGLTFSDIMQARDLICGYRNEDGKPHCSICPAFYPEHCKLDQYYSQKHLNIDNCYGFCVNNPRMAAEIMGFEVIEDEYSGATEKPTLPDDISAWTLAQAKEYCLEHSTWLKEGRDDSCRKYCELGRRHICSFGDSYDVYQWDLDSPRLTPAELEICKILGAKFVKVCNMTSYGVLYAELWSREPTTDGTYWQCRIAQVHASMFPSLKPGDCICVEGLTDG